MRPRLAPALALWACVGCNEPEAPLVCTDDLRPGVSVAVVDEASGASIVEGATLTLREGAYTETSSDQFGAGRLLGAWERAGTYEARVTREGYGSWLRTGVVVTADECHVITVELLARLPRAAAPTAPR